MRSGHETRQKQSHNHKKVKNQICIQLEMMRHQLHADCHCQQAVLCLAAATRHTSCMTSPVCSLSKGLAELLYICNSAYHKCVAVFPLVGKTALICRCNLSQYQTATCDSVALPPTSKKLAGEPPCNLMMSMVAIARPAPFTMQPMLPSCPI